MTSFIYRGPGPTLGITGPDSEEAVEDGPVCIVPTNGLTPTGPPTLGRTGPDSEEAVEGGPDCIVPTNGLTPTDTAPTFGRIGPVW